MSTETQARRAAAKRLEYLEAALAAIRVECRRTDRPSVVIAGSIDALARDALQYEAVPDE